MDTEKKRRKLNPKTDRIAPRVEPLLKQEIFEFCEASGLRVADFARTALVVYLEKVKTPAA